MLDSGIVGLAIGLILFFLVLSFLASGVNEVIEAFWQRRARYLEVGIWDLLGPLTKRFYDDPVIQALHPPKGRPVLVQGVREGAASRPGRKVVSGDEPEDVLEQRACAPKKNPSYIPATQFSNVVLHTVLQVAQEVSTKLTHPIEAGDRSGLTARVEDASRFPSDRPFRVQIDEEVFDAELGSATDRLELTPSDLAKTTRHAAQAAVKLVPMTAPSTEQVIEMLERSLHTDELPTSLRKPLQTFLERAGDNVDGLRTQLEGWFDSAMERVSGWYKRRTRWILFVIGIALVVVANADSIAVGQTLWRDATVRDALVSQASTIDSSEPSCDAGENPATCLTSLFEDVRDLDVPIGWVDGTGDIRLPDDFLGWVLKILGLALSALAISLGASFWFDLLGKALNLRSTGKPPAKATEGGGG